MLDDEWEDRRESFGLPDSLRLTSAGYQGDVAALSPSCFHPARCSWSTSAPRPSPPHPVICNHERQVCVSHDDAVCGVHTRAVQQPDRAVLSVRLSSLLPRLADVSLTPPDRVPSLPSAAQTVRARVVVARVAAAGAVPAAQAAVLQLALALGAAAAAAHRPSHLPSVHRQQRLALALLPALAHRSTARLHLHLARLQRALAKI